MHKSATPANGLSLEHIHLQYLMRIVQLQVCEHVRTASFNQPLLSLSLTKNVNYTANTSHKKRAGILPALSTNTLRHQLFSWNYLYIVHIITHILARTAFTTHPQWMDRDTGVHSSSDNLH